ncbi:hypothetical protein MTBSS4_570005 [Magnetospirillum sp. SS-4]|nr:hypothetical protein MTBSS4_570005 [Magnetospirillum sp. SS-4]
MHDCGRLSEVEFLCRDLGGDELDDPVCAWLLGLVSLQRGDFDNALGYARAALLASPDFRADLTADCVDRLNDLGALASSTRTPLYRKLFGMALAIRRNPATLSGLAHACSIDFDTETALACYREAAILAVPGTASSIRVAACLILARMGRTDDAIREIRAVLDEEPGNGNAWAGLAVILLMGKAGTAGDIQVALDHADRLAPDHPLTLHAGAMHAHSTGNMDLRQTMLNRLIAHSAATRPAASPAQRAEWEDFRDRCLERLGERDPSRVWFLFPQGGVGDHVHLFYLLGAFRRMHPDQRVVVCTSLGGDLGTCFQDRLDLLVDPGPTLSKNRVAPLAGCAPGRPHVVLPAFHDIDVAGQTIPLADLVRTTLGLPPDSLQQAGRPPRGGAATIRTLLASRRLPAGRTVLLAPHTNSNGSIGPGWWEDLAGRLTGAGYKVVCNGANMFSDKTTMVADIATVDVPLSLINQFVETAGYFIGVRSGLCDVLAFAAARMKVVNFHSSADSFSRRESYVMKANYPWWRGDEYFVADDAPFDPSILDGWPGFPP